MLNRLAELRVSKTADYNDTIVKNLEKTGFIVVKECETTQDKFYIIAATDESCPNCGADMREPKGEKANAND